MKLKTKKQAKPISQYESLDAFRKAKLDEAIEATKDIDWVQVLEIFQPVTPK